MIPDGNRRWAQARGLEPWEGHRIGAKKAESFVEWCLDQEEVSELTIYALSEENFDRPKSELVKLFEIYEDNLIELFRNDRIDQARLRLNLVSTQSKPLPPSLISRARGLCRNTRYNEGKVLNILLGYTGQSEVLQAVSSARNRFRNLFLGLREVDIERFLKVKSPCDLVIRTGSEEGKREAKSGFLLWQSAYSEYYHIDKFFPDVTLADFDDAWAYFKATMRKRGL